MGRGQFACLRVMHRRTSELSHQSHYSYRERDRETGRERDRSLADTEMLQSWRQQELQDRKFRLFPALKYSPSGYISPSGGSAHESEGASDDYRTKKINSEVQSCF